MKDGRIGKMTGIQEIFQGDPLLRLADRLAKLSEEEREQMFAQLEHLPKGQAWAKFLDDWFATKYGKGDC